jgi:hypothetical protein
MRTTGLPSTFLIARVIEAQRMCHALMECLSNIDTMATRDRALRSTTRPVTPDDMVSFLRGGREWLVQAQVDPNAHLPRQRGVPRGDAILCNHANENPGHCPCAPDCYCRQDGRTCSDVTVARLARERVNMLRDSHRHMDSLSEIVRHHEAADDV